MSYIIDTLSCLRASDAAGSCLLMLSALECTSLVFLPLEFAHGEDLPPLVHLLVSLARDRGLIQSRPVNVLKSFDQLNQY